MKKLMMTFAGVLFCTMMTTVFTACSSDDDDKTGTYSYTILFDFHNFSSTTDADQNAPADGGFNDWMNSILGAYKSALGVSSNTFTRSGNQADCDKKVYDDCKKAEPTVSTIKGGTATVSVVNNSSNKTVYSYEVTN